MTIVRLPSTMPRDARVQYLLSLGEQWSHEPALLAYAMRLPNDAGAILSTVQRLPFHFSCEPDAQCIEVDPRVVIAGGGDCTGKTTLLHAIAKALAVPSRVRWIEATDASAAHVVAQWMLAGRWQWMEGTRVGIPVDVEPFLDGEPTHARHR